MLAVGVGHSAVDPYQWGHCRDGILLCVQPPGRRYAPGERQTVMDVLRTEYRFELWPQDFFLTCSGSGVH